MANQFAGMKAAHLVCSDPRKQGHFALANPPNDHHARAHFVSQVIQCGPHRPRLQVIMTCNDHTHTIDFHHRTITAARSLRLQLLNSTLEFLHSILQLTRFGFKLVRARAKLNTQTAQNDLVASRVKSRRLTGQRFDTPNTRCDTRF
jgi:hypothetical protein